VRTSQGSKQSAQEAKRQEGLGNSPSSSRRFLLLLQIADSGFPVGGFAHSHGLEAMLKWGLLSDPAAVERFLTDAVTQVASGNLDFVQAAYRETAFQPLDHVCDAFLNNHVANRASRRQGQAFLSTVTSVFAFPNLIDFSTFVREQQLPGHFAPIFGRCTSLLGLQERESLELFLLMVLRGLLSSAIRLSLIGPLRAQALQYELAPSVMSFVDRWTQSDSPAFCQTAPVIDLLQATHDRVYSRLFQS